MGIKRRKSPPGLHDSRQLISALHLQAEVELADRNKRLADLRRPTHSHAACQRAAITTPAVI
jgi:hypothetical protein